MLLEFPTCRQIRCSRCYAQLWADIDAAVRCTSAQPRRSADGYQELTLKAAHVPRHTATWSGTTCVSLQAHCALLYICVFVCVVAPPYKDPICVTGSQQAHWQRSFRAHIIEASNSIACNYKGEVLRFQLRRCRAHVRTMPPTFVSQIHPPHACVRTVSSCACTVYGTYRTRCSAACTYVSLHPRILYTPFWSPLGCSCTAGSSTGRWRWLQEDASGCLDRSGDLAVRIDDVLRAQRPEAAGESVTRGALAVPTSRPGSARPCMDTRLQSQAN